jgi:hypothetical protein
MAPDGGLLCFRVLRRAKEIPLADWIAASASSEAYPDAGRGQQHTCAASAARSFSILSALQIVRKQSRQTESMV